MKPILTPAEAAALDAAAVGRGIDAATLMERAGHAVARATVALAGGRYGRRVTVVCGAGNNGGDGFVIARHLETFGHDVRLLLAVDPARVRGDAATNHAVAVRAGIPLSVIESEADADWLRSLAGADWIVDALLGTGASGVPRGAIAAAIRGIVAIRATGRGAKVLAVDLPSGLDCDTGEAPGDCIRADVTATFVAPKLGFAAPGADAFTGTVHVVGIGVPRRLLRDVDRPAPAHGSRPDGG